MTAIELIEDVRERFRVDWDHRLSEFRAAAASGKLSFKYFDKPQQRTENGRSIQYNAVLVCNERTSYFLFIEMNNTPTNRSTTKRKPKQPIGIESAERAAALLSRQVDFVRINHFCTTVEEMADELKCEAALVQAICDEYEFKPYDGKDDFQIMSKLPPPIKSDEVDQEIRENEQGFMEIWAAIVQSSTPEEKELWRQIIEGERPFRKITDS